VIIVCKHGHWHLITPPNRTSTHGRAESSPRTESGRLAIENSKRYTYISPYIMSSSYLPPSHPDQPEETIEALPSNIPDEEIDKPQPELVIQVCALRINTYTYLTASHDPLSMENSPYRLLYLDVPHSDMVSIKTSRRSCRRCRSALSD
jgi:hypothetical protein